MLLNKALIGDADNFIPFNTIGIAAAAPAVLMKFLLFIVEMVWETPFA
jgi:hypothetical protein